MSRWYAESMNNSKTLWMDDPAPTISPAFEQMDVIGESEV